MFRGTKRTSPESSFEDPPSKRPRTRFSPSPEATTTTAAPIQSEEEESPSRKHDMSDGELEEGEINGVRISKLKEKEKKIKESNNNHHNNHNDNGKEREKEKDRDGGKYKERNSKGLSGRNNSKEEELHESSRSSRNRSKERKDKDKDRYRDKSSKYRDDDRHKDKERDRERDNKDNRDRDRLERTSSSSKYKSSHYRLSSTTHSRSRDPSRKGHTSHSRSRKRRSHTRSHSHSRSRTHSSGDGKLSPINNNGTTKNESNHALDNRGHSNYRSKPTSEFEDMLRQYNSQYLSNDKDKSKHRDGSGSDKNYQSGSNTTNGRKMHTKGVILDNRDLIKEAQKTIGPDDQLISEREYQRKLKQEMNMLHAAPKEDSLIEIQRKQRMERLKRLEMRNKEAEEKEKDKDKKIEEETGKLPQQTSSLEENANKTATTTATTITETTVTINNNNTTTASNVPIVKDATGNVRPMQETVVSEEQKNESNKDMMPSAAYDELRVAKAERKIIETEKNEGFDLFSDSMDFEKELQKQTTVARAVDNNLHLTENWDDSEGYYVFRLNDRIKDSYEVVGNQGRGVFSTVLRVRYLKNNEIYVIKVIRNNETMFKAGQKEIDFLLSIKNHDPDNSKHCVRLLDHFEYRNHLCLVFEPMECNLRQLLKKVGAGKGFSINAVYSYTKQLMKALQLLNSLGIIHVDIKPDNILVSENRKVVKLCDFGSGYKLEDVEITPIIGSRYYRAPEVMIGLHWDCSVDMWSMACCLFELYTGKILFAGETNNHMLKLHCELVGKFPVKVGKKGLFWSEHFDDCGRFLEDVVDAVSGLELKEVHNFTQPTRDLMEALHPNGTNEYNRLPPNERKKVSEFQNLLKLILTLDPAKRITPETALKHLFCKNPIKKSAASSGTF